jgi:hypothetical protein
MLCTVDLAMILQNPMLWEKTLLILLAKSCQRLSWQDLVVIFQYIAKMTKF